MWSACACGYVTVQGRIRHDRAQATRRGVTSGAPRARKRSVDAADDAGKRSPCLPSGGGSHLASWREDGVRSSAPAPRSYRSGWSCRDRPAEPRRSAVVPAGSGSAVHRDEPRRPVRNCRARMHHDDVTDDEPARRPCATDSPQPGCPSADRAAHDRRRVRVDGELVDRPRSPSVTARAHRYHGPVGLRAARRRNNGGMSRDGNGRPGARSIPSRFRARSARPCVGVKGRPASESSRRGGAASAPVSEDFRTPYAATPPSSPGLLDRYGTRLAVPQD